MCDPDAPVMGKDIHMIWIGEYVKTKLELEGKQASQHHLELHYLQHKIIAIVS